MAEEKLNNNPEAEVFTIPEEFYGAQKKPAIPRALGVSASTKIAGSPSVSPAVPGSPSKIPIVKKRGETYSSKIVIIVVVIFLVVVVGGFSYYYIHQAQVAQQRLIEVQKQKEQSVVNPQPTPPTAPVVITPPDVNSTSTTSTPSATIQQVSYAVFPFKNYTSAEDTDNDGLTNVEEAIYGTNPNKPDTDEDGFSDGLEVANLYNPLGFKPVKLLDSGKVKAYVNPTYNYSVLSPLAWVVQALDANNEQVMLSSDTGEFVEILVEDNPLKLSVTDWYLGQSPGVSPSDLKTVTTKDGMKGILSPDGLAAYFPWEDRIFVVYYNIGLKTDVSFFTTFKMIINSFKLGVSSAAIPEQIFNSSTTTEPGGGVTTSTATSSIQ